MLNREKYAKEILDIVCEGDNFGLQNGKPVPCNNIKCRGCEFYSADCRANTRTWVNREYVEPPVDWSKVAVDTKILVRDHEDNVWVHRYFAKYEGGKIYAWSDGLTSWSDAGSINVSAWECAKLAESEESHD